MDNPKDVNISQSLLNLLQPASSLTLTSSSNTFFTFSSSSDAVRNSVSSTVISLEDEVDYLCIKNRIFQSPTECISVFSLLNESDLMDIYNSVRNDSLYISPGKFVPTSTVQLIWSILFAMMIMVAVVGNFSVLWIITGHRKMRTVTNMFLLNLTVADLIMAVFNAAFNFVYLLHSHWPFGQTYCVVNNFLATLTLASSVFTITATSIDRYIAVVHPLKPRMTKRRVVVIITLIWILASMLSLPNLLYSEAVTFASERGETRTICCLIWDDKIGSLSVSGYGYEIIVLMITYVIPMISLVITFSLMFRVLWGSKSIGEEIDVQRESIRSKRKVARMLMMVVILFAICWLPYHGYFVYSHLYPDVNYSLYIQHVFLFSYWLAMSNSIYNPIIYYWMNKRFRRYFASIFCFFSQRKWNYQPSTRTDYSSASGLNRARRNPSIRFEMHRHDSSVRRHDMKRTIPNGVGHIPESDVDSKLFNAK